MTSPETFELVDGGLDFFLEMSGAAVEQFGVLVGLLKS